MRRKRIVDAQASYKDVPAKVETVWDYRPSGGDVEVKVLIFI